MENDDGRAVAPEQVASAADPAPLLARLRAVGVGRLPGGRWLVSDPSAVERLLGSPAAAVAPPRSADDPVVAVQALMARFSDGEAHARRRAHAIAALEVVDAATAEARARQVTDRAIAGAARVDVMNLARRIPVLVLADLLGIPEPQRALAAVELLCRRLAPRLDDGDRPGAAEVMDGLEEAFGELDEATVNRVALLFQARDATAALVGLAAHHLLAGAPDAPDAPRVSGAPTVTVADIEGVAHLDPPAHLTTRRTTSEVAVTDAVTIPGGATVVVCLAAAEGHPRADASLSFGHGPHTCPGRGLAVAIAAGIVQALAARGAHLRAGPTFEPRPNLRLAQELLVRLRPEVAAAPVPARQEST